MNYFKKIIRLSCRNPSRSDSWASKVEHFRINVNFPVFLDLIKDLLCVLFTFSFLLTLHQTTKCVFRKIRHSWCFGGSMAKSKGPLVASSRSMYWNVIKKKSRFMCHVVTCVFPLPLHESKSFTSCKMSAHVVGHQDPRTESHKQPFGGQMVLTKGMWLIHDFPLESKCYQSSVEHYR